jgi:Acyclic terpene utilisation family protein AtuA
MKYTSSERGTRPIVIGGISACGGDRSDALLATISGPIPVDAICGDYMAELNLAWLSHELAADPTKGYEQSFLTVFKTAADKYIELRKQGRDIKVAVNAGGLRPQTLAREIRELLDTKGEEGKKVRVAWVTGDNILDQLNDSKSAVAKSIKHLSHGTPLEDWGYESITANAYIGCSGIVEALERGADIIILGRCTDASAAQAFGRWWHGWKEDDFDNLSLGLVTGHLIECGTYVVRVPREIHPNYHRLAGFFQDSKG